MEEIEIFCGDWRNLPPITREWIEGEVRVKERQDERRDERKTRYWCVREVMREVLDRCQWETGGDDRSGDEEDELVLDANGDVIKNPAKAAKASSPKAKNYQHEVYCGPSEWEQMFYYNFIHGRGFERVDDVHYVPKRVMWAYCAHVMDCEKENGWNDEEGVFWDPWSHRFLDYENCSPFDLKECREDVTSNTKFGIKSKKDREEVKKILMRVVAVNGQRVAPMTEDMFVKRGDGYHISFPNKFMRDFCDSYVNDFFIQL